MNKHYLVASALAVATLAVSVVLATASELPLGSLLGKAVWYLPYAGLVGTVRCLRFA